MKLSVCILALFLGFTMLAKAQSAELHQPDSIVIILDTIEQPSNTYGGIFTLACQYDSSGLLTYSRYESVSENLWHYKDDSYTYDSRHNLTKISSQLDGYDYYDVAYNQTRYTYTDGLLTLYCFYVYDMHYNQATRNPLRCYDSIVYKYDEASRITNKTVYFLSDHVCDITYKYTGNTTTIITEGYPNGQVDWQELRHVTQTFSEDGLLLSETITEINNPNTKIIYSYGTNSRLESVLSQQLIDDVWVNNQLLQYTFNVNGQLMLAEIKNWENDSFVETFRAVYELNEAGLPIEVVFEKRENEAWVEGSWKKGFYVFPESHLKRQNDLICKSYVQRIAIHYTATPMPDYDVDEHQSQEAFAALHPNPTTGLVTITGKDLKQAEVLNTLGQHVATTTGEGEMMQVDISHLPAGVYFVNVTDGEGRKCVRKVVKE